MNREIKFRGWDKYDKKMIYDLCQVDLFWNYYSYSDNIGLHFGKTGPNCVVEDFENKYIMQYTGLKDKNGKEIYEGDILDVITINDNFADEFLIDINTKFIVDYNNDSFAPSLISETCKNIYHTFDEIDSNDVEVIGNIYENPELLEGGNND